eukprot:jgi/Ulvmu1/512/UM001_0520.1
MAVDMANQSASRADSPRMIARQSVKQRHISTRAISVSRRVDRDNFQGASATSGSVRAISAGIAAVVLLGFQPGPAAAAPMSTPFTEAQSIPFGLHQGRIAACPGAVNPNCVSTSSTNTMYAPAWRAEVSSLDAALQDLDAAILGGFKGAYKLSEKQTPSGYYVSYSVPGKFRDKPDTVELLIKPEGVQNRQWEGDREGAAIFYRSIAGDVKYIWPLTQPVTDLDTQKKRMQQIRQTLGWPLIGCELIECYSD